MGNMFREMPEVCMAETGGEEEEEEEDAVVVAVVVKECLIRAVIEATWRWAYRARPRFAFSTSSPRLRR